MRSFRSLIAAVVLLPAAVLTVAYAATYKRDVPAKLAAKAKISEGVATQAALERIQGGKIVELELEHEKGGLLYSIHVQAPGQDGLEEVLVSAQDGSIISVKHDAAKDDDDEEGDDEDKATTQR